MLFSTISLLYSFGFESHSLFLHSLSMTLPMNNEHANWDIRILACFPEGARNMVKEICDKEDLCLYFCSPNRKSGYAGLYTSSGDIYIDAALDRFSFLKVFMHELAHHEFYKKYSGVEESSMPDSHGEEFHNIFRSLFEPFLTEKVFPSDLLVEIDKWTKRHSTGWKKFPNHLIEKYCMQRKLTDLLEGSHFQIADKYFDGCFHGFIKGRFDDASSKFLCLGSYGWFLFDPNTMVKMI